jgi:hypothetical protein
LIEDRRKKS